MGGIGKTAPQLIYNDDRIQTHFDKTIWICVSDPFDQSKIARAILQALDPDSTISLQNTTPLQTLSSKIRENIKEKKFFLVLDDVWVDHGEDWEQLKATFQSHISGSRILVTTRKESVAKHMESSHVFPLNKLSDDICWRIFSQKAFTRRNKINCENLEDIGRAIAKECKGLPLAAKTLGGLLQDKLRREEWQNVLNSEIWKLKLAQQYIFTPLLLSYYDLPSTIKLCLLYCVIFPKDENFDKVELVQRWMAQGYLNCDDNLEIELRGEDYFKCLATHSFFQDFDKDVNGNIISFKMHDLVHDFVQFLTKDEFVTEVMVEDLTLGLSSKKTRHLRLVSESCSSSTISIHGAENLRSLVAVSLGSNNPSSEALWNLFSHSKHLRFLEFDLFSLDAKIIAQGIGELIHLRYLSLIRCCDITNLPEAVCELRNLQSLNLKYCFELEKLPVGIGNLINLRYLRIVSCGRLEKLPVGIGNLINLRYLRIEFCDRLEKMPVGIGNLINLRYVGNVGCHRLSDYPKGIINFTSLMTLNAGTNIRMRADGNDADELSIGDLENLDLLGGDLRVELVGNSLDWNEARRAKLHNKIHLKRIEIGICSPYIKKEEVFQALNPPSNLHVKIFDYEGWVELKRNLELLRAFMFTLNSARPHMRDAGASGSGENNADGGQKERKQGNRQTERGETLLLKHWNLLFNMGTRNKNVNFYVFSA